MRNAGAPFPMLEETSSRRNNWTFESTRGQRRDNVKASVGLHHLEFMIERSIRQTRAEIKKTKNQYCQAMVLIVSPREMKNHHHYHHHHHHGLQRSQHTVHPNADLNI